MKPSQEIDMSASPRCALPFRTALVALAAGAAISLAVPCAAQEAGGQPGGRPGGQVAPGGAVEGGAIQSVEAEVAPEARPVLERLQKFYEGLPGASVRATFSVTTPNPEGDQPEVNKTELSMAAADPNRFVFPLQGEGEFDQFKIVSTGETLFMYYGGTLNKYVQRDAPADMDAVIDAMSQGERPDLASFTSPIFPFLKLMGGSTLAEIEGVQRIEFAGTEELGGIPHEKLRLVGAELDVDVWVRAGEEAWVSQIKPDASKGLGDLGELGKALEAQMPQVLLTFDRWESKAEFAEGTFAFTPPEGSERVESLMDAMREQAGAAGGEGGASSHDALIGKAAPALGIDMLGGGKADLITHEGKVVVLDFWASWCPPCVRGLPVMSRLAEKYKEKGLVFYAVNVEEDEQTVRRFLEKQKLSIPVAMDTGGEASGRYGVTGIPQTVLIGKDGTVQAVHVGFTPEMEQDLAKQIEKLLAGEKLADRE